MGRITGITCYCCIALLSCMAYRALRRRRLGLTPERWLRPDCTPLLLLDKYIYIYTYIRRPRESLETPWFALNRDK